MSGTNDNSTTNYMTVRDDRHGHPTRLACRHGGRVAAQTGTKRCVPHSCECSMCPHVIIRPPLPILPYMLPTIRGQHHIVCQEFSCGAVGACSKYSTTPLMHHMQQGPLHFESPPTHVVTHTNSKHTEQARPTYGICFVIHVAWFMLLLFGTYAGRWTLGVTLVCEVFLFQGAREL